MNEIQEAIFMKIKEAVCTSVECYPVRHNAIGIITPFLDWIGERVEIYVTEHGEITDGGQTLNQMKALNNYNDFLKWPDQKNYLDNYNINPNSDSLDLRHFETPEGILKYAQGIARLPGFFEIKPLGEKQDKFPTIARKFATDTLITEYPNRPKEGVAEWAFKLTQPKSFKVNNVSIHSDMSPINNNRIVEIISHQSSNDSEKKSHIREKLFNPIFLEKTNPDVEPYVVTFNLLDYPRDAQDLLCSQTEVIELCKPDAGLRLTKMLAEA